MGYTTRNKGQVKSGGGSMFPAGWSGCGRGTVPRDRYSSTQSAQIPAETRRRRGKAARFGKLEKRRSIIGRTTLRDLVVTSPGSSIRAGSILGHTVLQLGLVRRIIEQKLTNPDASATSPETWRAWLVQNARAKIQNCSK